MRNSQCAGNGFGVPAKVAGLRPDASYHMPAPMSRDEREVCAILLGGIALIGIVGTFFLNTLAAI